MPPQAQDAGNLRQKTKFRGDPDPVFPGQFPDLYPDGDIVLPVTAPAQRYEKRTAVESLQRPTGLCVLA